MMYNTTEQAKLQDRTTKTQQLIGKEPEKAIAEVNQESKQHLEQLMKQKLARTRKIVHETEAHLATLLQTVQHLVGDISTERNRLVKRNIQRHVDNRDKPKKEEHDTALPLAPDSAAHTCVEHSELL